jgi:hypothetical protein
MRRKKLFQSPALLLARAVHTDDNGNLYTDLSQVPKELRIPQGEHSLSFRQLSELRLKGETLDSPLNGGAK